MKNVMVRSQRYASKDCKGTPAEAEVRVQLLGPVLVEPDRPCARARSLSEVVAWLALHPDATGLAIDRDLGLTAESRMATMSRLRGWLGAEALPAARGSGYTLRCSTDVEQFRRLVCDRRGRVDRRVPTSALFAALLLVRGEPLADVRGSWADAERLDLSLLIGETADELLSRSRDARLRAWAQMVVGRIPLARATLGGRFSSPRVRGGTGLAFAS